MSTHTYADAQTQHRPTNNKLTNCSAVNLVAFFLCAVKEALALTRRLDKRHSSQGGGQSEQCVVLMMGRRVLVVTSVDQDHGNRREGGNIGGLCCCRHLESSRQMSRKQNWNWRCDLKMMTVKQRNGGVM